jgi:hypothetical protein
MYRCVQAHPDAERTLSGLLMGLVVFFTVLLALAFGIGLSYTTANAIFRAMSQKTEHVAAPLTTAAEAGSSH